MIYYQTWQRILRFSQHAVKENFADMRGLRVLRAPDARTNSRQIGSRMYLLRFDLRGLLV
ncbi:hypothetical protein TNCV_4559491, partial [Trichonephila clavipes]